MVKIKYQSTSLLFPVCFSDPLPEKQDRRNTENKEEESLKGTPGFAGFTAHFKDQCPPVYDSLMAYGWLLKEFSIERG